MRSVRPRVDAWSSIEVIDDHISVFSRDTVTSRLIAGEGYTFMRHAAFMVIPGCVSIRSIMARSSPCRNESPGRALIERSSRANPYMRRDLATVHQRHESSNAGSVHACFGEPPSRSLLGDTGEFESSRFSS